MTNETDKLLAKVNYYKQQAQEYTTTLQDARTRKALIDDQLEKLSDKLVEVAGVVDWAELGNLIEKAAKRAQEAVQDLEEALQEAKVDYE